MTPAKHAPAVTWHYAGALRIVNKRSVTTIGAGFIACSALLSRQLQRGAALSTTRVQAEVTCKRCLRLIALSLTEE